MVDGTGQYFGGRPDDARHIAAGVDHRVPPSFPQGGEIPFPISLELLDLGEQFRFAEPPVEEGDPVAFPERRLDEVAPEESRTAEDQYVHRWLSPKVPEPYLPIAATRSSGRLMTLSITPYSTASSELRM